MWKATIKKKFFLFCIPKKQQQEFYYKVNYIFYIMRFIEYGAFCHYLYFTITFIKVKEKCRIERGSKKKRQIIHILWIGGGGGGPRMWIRT